VREIGGDEAAAPAPAASGAGLRGSYFENLTLAGVPALTRIEGVNFDWGSSRPSIGVRADKFSVRWSGTITMPLGGSYRLQTNTSDGVRLWIDGSQVINAWDRGSGTRTSGAVSFSAGQRVPVVLEFFDRSGRAYAQLRWLPPGTTSYVAVPTSNLNAQ